MEALSERINLSQLTGNDLTGMLAMILTFLGLMLGLFGAAWFEYRKACLNVAIKRDMIARGYTAKEIVVVLNAEKAREPAEENLPDVPPAKPVRQVA